MTIKEIRKQYLATTGEKAPDGGYAMWLEMLVVEKSKMSEGWKNRAIKVERKMQEQLKEVADLKNTLSQVDGVEYDEENGVLVIKEQLLTHK